MRFILRTSAAPWLPRRQRSGRPGAGRHDPRRRRVARRWRFAAGCVWLGSWGALLLTLHSPWRDLGGLVPESLRWLERIAPCAAGPAGVLIGSLARELAERDPRVTHARLLRYLLYPPLVATAAAIVVLDVAAGAEASLVSLTGLLAYWAGLDAGFAAWPLLQGRPYRLLSPVESPADAPPGARKEEEEEEGLGVDW